MTEPLGRAELELGTNQSKLDQNLAKAETQTKGWLGRVQGSFDRLQKSSSFGMIMQGVGLGGGMFAAQGVAMAIGKSIDFIGSAISKASNLNETITKTAQIFGQEAMPALQKWAELADRTLGQTKQQALDAASTFAIFGKSAGLAGEELVGFSQDMVGLSSDLASFFNTSPEEAITAIGAALRGESEPIRRYGVLLDEATLRQRALKLGIIQTTTQALTPQQRVLAAQAEILAQTSDAQGDFARTSDGLANQERILAARIDNLTTKVGEKLLPAALAVTTALSSLASVATDNAEPALDAVGWVIGRLGDGLTTIAAPLIIAKGLIDDLTGGAKDAAVGMQVLPDGMRRAMEGTVSAARGGAGTVVDIVRQIPQDMADAMLAEQQKLADPIHQLLEFIKAELSPAEVIARDKGFLMSKELARGLASNDPLIRQKAQEMQRAALVEIGSTAGVWSAGKSLGALWIRGIVAAIAAGRIDMITAVTGIRNLMGHSLPTAGPLKGDAARQGGLAIGGHWTGGIVDAIDATLSGVVGRAASALNGGRFMPPAMAGAGAGGYAASGGSGPRELHIHYELTVDGVKKSVGTREEALDELAAMGAFGDGRIG